MLHLRLRLSCALILLAACGEKGGETDDPGPTTGSTSDGTASVGSTDTPTTGEPSQCVDPSQTEVGPAVEVTLRNSSAAAVFVNLANLCSVILPFEVVDADDVVVRTTLADCEWTCDAVFTGGCGCALGCGPGEVVRIDPGGTFAATWSGARWFDAEVPESCAMDGCEPRCVAKEQAPAGAYTLRARGLASVGGCAPCTCEPGPEGSCSIFGEAEGAEIVAEAALEYPGQTEVELVFE